MRTLSPTIFLATATLSSLQAQQAAHPLAGTWSIEFPAGAQMINGAVTTIIGHGTIVMVAQGDSLGRR